MGQKINPHVLRLGPLYDWNSRWFDERTYKRTMLEDHALRKKLLEKLKMAGVASIDIERSINSIKIIAHVSRPGMVIGRAGTGLEDLKKFLVSLLPKKKNMPKIDIQVEQVKEPNLDAFLVAKNVADQLEKRLPFKRILIQNVDRVMTAGARGVKIALAGRIAGAEIGRKEKLQKGTVPLSTIREHITFASVPALTKKGYIGIKVWINGPREK